MYEDIEAIAKAAIDEKPDDLDSILQLAQAQIEHGKNENMKTV